MTADAEWLDDLFAEGNLRLADLPLWARPVLTPASPAATEPSSVPEPSTTDSGCSSKDDRGLPSACFRCGAAIWNGNVHRNGRTECDMWQVPGV